MNNKCAVSATQSSNNCGFISPFCLPVCSKSTTTAIFKFKLPQPPFPPSTLPYSSAIKIFRPGVGISSVIYPWILARTGDT